MRRALLLLRRRLIGSIPVLLIVVVGTFLLLEAAPGDAVDAYVLSLGGGDPALLQSMRESYGLDRSMPARLWLYLTSLLRFDLGAEAQLLHGVTAALQALARQLGYAARTSRARQPQQPLLVVVHAVGEPYVTTLEDVQDVVAKGSRPV